MGNSLQNACGLGSNIPSLPENEPNLAKYCFIRSGLKIFLYQDDITQLPGVECVVCPTNQNLDICCGVANAIFRIIDVKDYQTRRANTHKGKLLTTQAVTVKTKKVEKYQFVIFASTPNVDDYKKQGHGYTTCLNDLTTTLRNCIKEACNSHIKKIAFPAVGSERFGFTKDDVAESMIEAFLSFADNAKGLTEIHVVDLDVAFVKIVQKKLDNTILEKHEAGLLSYSNQSSPVDRPHPTNKVPSLPNPPNPRARYEGFEVINKNKNGNSFYSQNNEELPVAPPRSKHQKKPTEESGHKSTFAVHDYSCFEFVRSHLKIIAYTHDITQVSGVDGIVCPCNASLDHSHGVAFDIAKSAGPQTERECHDYVLANKSLPVTDALTTAAGGPHQNTVIIHACVPKLEDYKASQITEPSIHGGYSTCLADLKLTILNCLREARRHGVTKLALPAVGSGKYGIHAEDIAEVTIDALVSLADDSGSLKEIHLVDIDPAITQLFRSRLDYAQHEIVKAELQQCD